MEEPVGASGRAREGAIPPAEPPHRVRVPVNVHDWENLTFLHWPVDVDTLARHVPRDLTGLTHGGQAGVSATPFFIRVRPPGLPAVPGVSAFPETNLRTYVSGPDGRDGLWFIRMEAAAAWFVATLRAVGLPYVRQRMSVEVGDGRVAYRSHSAGVVSHHVVVRAGAPRSPPTGGDGERFLTARWGAYHRRGPVLLHTPADHPPWPLHAAEVEHCDVGMLFAEAGLPPPDRPPLVQFSPGVTVKIGRPWVVS
jgi:uncharacterized protein